MQVGIRPVWKTALLFTWIFIAVYHGCVLPVQSNKTVIDDAREINFAKIYQDKCDQMVYLRTNGTCIFQQSNIRICEHINIGPMIRNDRFEKNNLQKDQRSNTVWFDSSILACGDVSDQTESLSIKETVIKLFNDSRFLEGGFFLNQIYTDELITVYCRRSTISNGSRDNEDERYKVLQVIKCFSIFHGAKDEITERIKEASSRNYVIAGIIVTIIIVVLVKGIIYLRTIIEKRCLTTKPQVVTVH